MSARRVLSRMSVVAGLLAAVTAAVGTGAADAAIDPPGTPYTFGTNAFGELGDGTNASHYTPRAVSGLTDAVDIAGGREHVLALRPDGTVVAWGSNQYGQLGLGAAGGQRTTPTPVPGLTSVVAVASGHNHSLALRSDGSVWAWGYNFAGMLGDGTTTSRATPVKVSGTATYTYAAAGRDMSYAIRSDGTVWAWGLNSEGQLGDGTTTTRLTPVRVGSLTDVVNVAGGRDHGLAVRSDGTVWAWGSNDFGQVGDGTTTDRLSPVLVTSGAVRAAAGAHHSMVVKTDGTASSWGRNYRSQLGDGTTTLRTRPVQVVNLSNVVELGSGRDTGIAVLADGSVKAWGNNVSGQLGNGTTTSSTTPIPVPGLTGAKLAAGGSAYSVVLTSTGTPPPNQPPTARIGVECTGLACTYSSATSTDPDGTIVGRTWDFGDGAGATTSAASHTYAAAGTYLVSLTVTDDDGASGSASTSAVVAPLPPAAVAFRASATSNRNSSSNSVTVPGSVMAGDQLVLFVTTNGGTTASTPQGWTLLGDVGRSDMHSWAFTRAATGSIGGSAVAVTFGSRFKSAMTLVAYSGAAPPITAVASVETVTSASHAAPAAPVTQGSRVVAYWSDKASGSTGWSTPAGLTARAVSVGSGGGAVSSIAAESATLAAGTWPGATATSSVSTYKAITWTVVVPPG